MRPLQCMGPDSLYYLGHGFLSTSADLGGEGGQRVYLSLFFSWFWISLSLFSIVFFCVSLSLVFGHFSPYKFVSLSLSSLSMNYEYAKMLENSGFLLWNTCMWTYMWSLYSIINSSPYIWCLWKKIQALLHSSSPNVHYKGADFLLQPIRFIA